MGGFLMKTDFVDKLVQPEFYGYGSNICFDCDRCYGKCPWSEIDSETGRVKFQPVEGWVTKVRSRKVNRKWEVVQQIIECPLFVPSERRVNP
jgi:Fe-S-cluster-containing hydrogenase component 2